MKQLLLGFIGLSACVSGATESAFVGTYGRTNLVVATGETVDLSSVAVEDGGLFVKSGGGALNVPLGGIWQSLAFAPYVRDGLLTFTSDAVAPFARPDAALAKAALWVAADTNTTNVALGGETTYADDEVAVWYDVRETTNAATRSFPCMVCRWDTNATAAARQSNPPQRVTGDIGPAVDFGGCLSSKFMHVVDPSGADGEITNICEIYWVYELTRNLVAYVFSPATTSEMQGSLATLHNYFSELPSASYALGDNVVFCENGKRIDPFLSKAEKRPVQLDLLFTGTKTKVAAFFSDRPDKPGTLLKDRSGGDRLYEALFFTNTLSSAERASVREYLRRKWLSPTVAIAGVGAAGASIAVNVPAAQSATISDQSFSADALEKSGDGELVALTESVVKLPIGVKAGSLSLLGDVSVALESGATLDAADAGVSPTSFGKGVTVTRGADVAAGTCRKTGRGFMRTLSVPTNVSRVEVADGTLSLGSGEPDRVWLSPGSETAIAHDNFGFERAAEVVTPSTYQNIYYISKSTKVGSSVGWSGKKNADEQMGSINSGWGFVCPANGTTFTGGYQAPEGSWVVALKGDVSIWTTFTVTTPGVYELSFRAGGRSSDNNLIEVLVGSAAAASAADPDVSLLTSLGTWRTKNENFPVRRTRTPHLEVGEYVLYFKSPSYGTDRTACLDDIHLTLLPEVDARAAHRVPNGDFESMAANGIVPTTSTIATTVPGWTFERNGTFSSSDQYGGVFVAVADTRYSATQPRFYPAEDQLYGQNGLFFFATGSVASTTFVPPAGTWHLACRVRRWGALKSLVTDENNFLNGPLSLDATVTAGDSTPVSLGTLTQTTYLLETQKWPVSFTSDGATPVTLAISPTDSTTFGAGVIDDLMLLPPDEAGEAELVSNGSFENTTAWTYVKDGSRNCQRLEPDSSAQSRSLWGQLGSGYEGRYVGRITGQGRISQRVTLPEDGFYRLAFCAASRMDSTARGFNPLAISLEAATSAETTLSLGTVDVTSTNYVMQTLYVAGKAGSYDLTFAGTIADDRSTAFDRVSLMRDRMRETAPVSRPDLVLDVSAGAKLSLDYNGTMQVRTVRLGGKNRFGEISAATYPEYIQGPGKLKANRRGFAICVY